MRQSARFLLAACLALNVAPGEAAEAAATGETVSLQDFGTVLASGQASAARWMRGPDSYLLQVVIERRKSYATPAPTEPPEQVPLPDPGLESGDRARFFIADTIRNLRGLDPWLACSRTPSLIDPRQRPRTSFEYMNQPFPPQFKERRLDVWLLKADGTQVQPATYSCATNIIVGNAEVTYRFPLIEALQAAAVAVRIDEDYYIEKLQWASPPASW